MSESTAVTIYKNFWTQEGSHITLDLALSRIKNGKSKESIETLRVLVPQLQNARELNEPWVFQNNLLVSVTDSKERKKIKKKIDEIELVDEAISSFKKQVGKIKNSLPCILFSGVFSKREDSYLVYHSGYIIIDIDKIDNPGFYKANIFDNLSYVRACWISPSGNGVKILVKVTDNPKNHRGHFESLKTVFENLDPSGINESRICYESYDEDILIREEEDTDIYEGWTMPSSPTELTAGDMIFGKTGSKTDYSIVQRIVSMIRGAISGERNSTLLKACRLAGGYIAKGSIIESDILPILDKECMNLFGSEYETEKHTIENGIKYGKERPIHELEEEITITEETHSVFNIFDFSDQLFDQFENGIKRGDPTYFKEIDDIKSWSRKKARICVIAAPPEYGKSEFIKQLYLLQAIHEGSRSVVYSPEETETEFYMTLLHSLLGKSPEKKAGVTREEFRKAMEFIRDHIFYVYPKTKHSVENIFANFAFMAQKMYIRNFCIDPITKLSYLSKDRDDKFLGEFYAKCDFFIREFDCNMDVGVHPAKLMPNKDGEFDPLTIYSIAGGAMTANSVHDLLVLDRPDKNKNPQSTAVHLYFRKIKNRKVIGNGIMADLVFDKHQNRYYSGGVTFMEKWREREQLTLFDGQEKLPEIIDGKRAIPLLIPFDSAVAMSNFDKIYGANDQQEIDF